jgi:hypothetical protein
LPNNYGYEKDNGVILPADKKLKPLKELTVGGVVEK